MNKIIICRDFELIKSNLINKFGRNNLRIFEKNEILLEDTNAAKDEAYIAEKEKKIIVLIGHKFRVEAQNSLLLILENTPKNIEFILISNSKNVFLPTIRSRLIIENHFIKQVLPKTGLNFKNLSLNDINIFLNKQIELEKEGTLDKIALQNLFCAIVRECFESGIKFKEKELNHINKLMILINLNTKARSVLTPLLLMIMDTRR
ncbi:DNA polymerase III subunit delta' [Campylobacter ureolyticus]|uniref:DNA polymerase III subunit delta' n=1 Tax=Campylobacter ureolyticus TaxID=827 RepID=UPI000DF0FF07|nr:DNA polymerase III subunit delta' [Campylobacter ureolyticus]QIX85793.1 hypothetical protein FOB81_00235 [Campylobacter ureolyticus]STA70446.1 DNA polymerase III subunit delta' [Campylobacter ureolyticus]